ncbi:hypothetical protein SADUNF_Sadunf15G0057600 [Salix dunnii]|uniref:Uncharacterized protein n=1 Tax=Salix dunnii TaxID=1413687 RepID=A0A835JE74_9ROSI|nr:hypothetical protein SADUNF_Sadunf15G0057600 [Salix dunnii]
MSLLQVITKASADSDHVVSQSEYPIILNTDDIFPNLKPALDNLDATSLANPVSGWQLSQSDSQLIDSGKKFYTKLKRKLKDNSNFNKDGFFEIFIPFLEKIGHTAGIAVGINSSDAAYTRVLIEKVGFLMGRDVAGLVMKASISLEIWDLVETLVVNGVVDHPSYSDLVMSLVMKNRSDLLSLTIQHASDFGLSELLSILKYFLCPSKEAYSYMVNVRKEWESQAMLAIEMASDKNLSEKKSQIAKDASILLMLAHDGFLTSELCLHYLLASPIIDEAIFSSSISKLNGKEMMSLIRYLGKWLRKYEMFPQAVPCPKASSVLGLKACDWVPKLEDIVRCLGLMLDENFSSLVLHPGFHEELNFIGGFVASLATEAKLSCTVANVIENLRTQSKGEQI